MSGHLIFKTLSSDEHLKMMSCLERPHSLEACFFSSNPEPDDWTNTQEGDFPKDEDLDLAQIHLDLRLSP